MFEILPELIISSHLHLEQMWLKPVQEEKEESLKGDGLFRDKENLLGVQMSCEKAKQNKEFIHFMGR